MPYPMPILTSCRANAGVEAAANIRASRTLRIPAEGFRCRHADISLFPANKVVLDDFDANYELI
jgi:hypothetical protein